MKTKSITNIFLLTIVTFSVCSCKTVSHYETKTIQEPTQQVVGNAFEDMVGKTKNQILQTMSSPRRTETDGAGGEILVYEDIKYVTNSSESFRSSSNNYSRTDASAEAASAQGYLQNGYAGVAGSYAAADGRSITRESASTSSDRTAQSVAKEDKKYVNFFINPQGICYHVTANYGYKYKDVPGTYQDCKKTVKEYSPAGFALWVFPVAGLIYTIIYACKNGDIVNIECGQPYQK